MSDSQFEFVQCQLSQDEDENEEAPKPTVSDLVPTKSGSVYLAAYQKFIKWCEGKNIDNYSENVLLEYFSELTSTMRMKSSSIGSQYSMIKSLLNINHGIDISKYSKVRAYLKKQNEGYTPQKTRGFTKQQIVKFLCEASDEQYLGTKIVLIIGISGACRREEMVRLKIDDIEDLGSLLRIKIPDSMTNKTRSFTVIGETSLNIYRKYISLRPEGMTDQRLFLKYLNGKCHRLVMGKNKIGAVPKEVAAYLKLPHWKEYTGHCFKRTSATLFVDREMSY